MDKPPSILAVTILTSLDDTSLSKELRTHNSVPSQVRHLALLAKEAGLDGVVASPHEIEIIKEACGDDFIVLTPGIRLPESSTDDQKRITTPAQAIKKGADYIVVGRPIYKSENPVETTLSIIKHIKGN